MEHIYHNIHCILDANKYYETRLNCLPSLTLDWIIITYIASNVIVSIACTYYFILYMHCSMYNTTLQLHHSFTTHNTTAELRNRQITATTQINQHTTKSQCCNTTQPLHNSTMIPQHHNFASPQHRHLTTTPPQHHNAHNTKTHFKLTPPTTTQFHHLTTTLPHYHNTVTTP